MKTSKWLLLVLGSLGCAAGCQRGNKVDAAPSAPAAAVVRVTRRDLANDMEIASEFQPYQEIEVYAKVSGYIKKLNVDWGAHVKQGQVLAVLEIPELEQQLQQDEAAVHRSENDLDRAREQMNQADSMYKVAHLGYTRLQNVQKSQPGLVAQQDLDAAEGKDLEANAGAAGAKDALAGAEQALLVAKATFEKDRAMFAYSQITAPFDGVVTAMDAYTGALLPAGTSSNIGTSSLCRLSQNDRLRLVIPLPERAVPDVHVGQTVSIRVSSLNKTSTGKIVRVSGQIDRQTRTMHTEVEVPNPQYELLPGMYASVELPLHEAVHALSVPTQAVQATADGKGTVLVVNGDHRIERRNVTLGIQTATDVEIVSGVQENDQVIFGSQAQYQTGQLVTPKQLNSEELE